VSIRSAVCNRYPLLDCLEGPICDDSFLSLLLNPTFSVFPRVMPPIRWHMKSARHLEWHRFTPGKIPIDLHLLPKLRNMEAKRRRKYYVEELLHLNQYNGLLKFTNPCVTCFNLCHLGFLFQLLLPQIITEKFHWIRCVLLLILID
jgi:hypothetical protein